MRRALALSLAALLFPSFAPARDATPAQIIKRFNKERKANGFPGGVRLNKTWSRWCGLHNRWMKWNHSLAHQETRGTRGYTKNGDWAGQSSVLSQDTTWKRANPWLNAPIHLNQMLAPRLIQAGAHESRDRNCFTTYAGYDWERKRPLDKDKVYRYPRVAPFAQTAFEAPHSPQHWIGIREGRTTGPYILVFWDGPDPELAVLKSARMTGPGGRVKVRVLNNHTHTGDGYSLAFNSGFVLPPRPLRKGRKYRVSVTFTTDKGVTPKRSFKSSFTFRTSARHLKGLGPAWTGRYTD